MKERTGARLLLSAPDAALAARGGRNDFAFGDRFAYAPVTADEIVREGTTVSLGGTTLTALMTPGHTQGGTSWQTTVMEDGKPLRVVFANSMTAPGYRLAGNSEYPAIMEDFRASFARLRGLAADVFLTTHESLFRVKDARDVSAAREYLERTERTVEREYQRQSAAQVLDSLHELAARADGERYFDLFAGRGT
jgi:metallo-beta-lactamase class B